jgi:hypothetical protein
MTDKSQNQIHHMRAFQRVGFVFAGTPLENHAKSVPVGHVEKSEG